MTELRVSDIHCDACIRAMTLAVKDLDDQATLQADLITKLVQVESTASDQAVGDAIRDAGFTVEPG
jgi:copper chaperone